MTVRVNQARLWTSLMEMATVGATGKGGCNRLALTDLDIKARNLFATWCRDEGMNVEYDAAGNMFSRFEGADPGLAPVVIGSHLDTQPTGGKFDGVLGVLAGLEVVRSLREAGIRPVRSLEIANWMNEEGARFAPAMMGSGVFAGAISMDEIRTVRDRDGVSVGQELDRHGYTELRHPADRKMHAYIELHIEQGPVLEAEETRIGVVTGAQGIRWYDVTITGHEAHAGPTPMSYRKDPVTAVPALVQGVLSIGNRDSESRATIGQLHASPGTRNVIPGAVDLSVDLRHPNDASLSIMNQELRSLVEHLNEQHEDLLIKLRDVWHSPVVAFDDNLIQSVRCAAQKLEIDYTLITSGAGHDALMVARKVPTAMIFIPCRDGISHNEAEHIEPHQAVDGASALLNVVMSVCSE